MSANDETVRLARSQRAAIQRLQEEEALCIMPGSLDDFMDNFDIPYETIPQDYGEDDHEQLITDNEMKYVNDLETN